MSSGLPLPTEEISPALLSAPGMQAEPCPVEDEEFPSELPGHYDWMLQPASQSNAKRIKQFAIVSVAILLIVFSVFVAHEMENPSPSVLASPTAPAR